MGVEGIETGGGRDATATVTLDPDGALEQVIAGEWAVPQPFPPRILRGRHHARTDCFQPLGRGTVPGTQASKRKCGL